MNYCAQMRYDDPEAAALRALGNEKTGRSHSWRLVHTDVRFRDPHPSVGRAAVRALVDERLSGVATAVDVYVSRGDLELEWREASLFSRSSLGLTAAEPAELTAGYVELLRRWASHRPTGRSRALAVRVDPFEFSHDPEQERP